MSDPRHKAGNRAFEAVGWAIVAAPMALFFAIPLMILASRAGLSKAMAQLSEPAAQDAIRLTLFTSVLATVLTVLLGTPLAYAVARRRIRGARALDALVDLPIVLPPAVAGVALLLAFGRSGPIGSALHSAGIDLVFTPMAVVLAQTFVAAPLYIRLAITAFRQIEDEHLLAAQLDGATPVDAAWKVALPLARGALASGAAMAWARAVGEFGATLIFAGNFPGRTQTMPLAIYLGFEMDLDLALALSVVLLAVSVVVLVAVRVFGGGRA